MQTLEKLSDRFLYQTPVSDTDRPILGYVVGDSKALMIDAGNSEAHAKYFLQELKEQNLPEPTIVALTHWHWDHIFGLSALNMVSISSQQTKVEMEKLLPFEWSDEAIDQRVHTGVEIEFCAKAIKLEFGSARDIRVTLPDITFEDRVEIDLGGVTCILQYVGGDHAADSTIVYIKEENILFLGDAIYPDIYSEKRNYTVQTTLQLLDTIEQFDADTYILSHWKPASKEEYQQEATLLRTIANLTVEYDGDYNNMKEAYQKKVNRELNEDELETIEYFVNGYGK